MKRGRSLSVRPGLLLLACLWADVAHALDVDALWDYERPLESEQRFNLALSQLGNTGEAISERAELLTQLARAQSMQSAYANAALSLDYAREALPQSAPHVSVRYALERGRLMQAQTDSRRAWRWFRGALMLAQHHELDFLSIDAMHMMALSSTGKAALDWNLKALAMAEQSAAPRARDWLASLYNNIGWQYHDQKDYPRALEYLRRAQTWHEAAGSGRPLLVARWSVAKVLRLSGKTDEALALQLELEQAWRRQGAEDGYVLEEIAEGLHSSNRVREAREYFARAYTVLARDGWLAKREPARMLRMRNLGQVGSP